MGNVAEALSGGGIFQNVPAQSLSVVDCVFSGNQAIDRGGAIASQLTLANSFSVANSTLTANTGSNGGGIFNDGGAASIINTIVWGNVGEPISGPATVTYSDVEGGHPGAGNIDADPLFVDPANGDFRLQPGSPCIDAGNNWGVPQDTADLDGDGDTRELTPWDLDGNPLFNADPADFDPGCGVPVVVDMGAYEFQFDSVNEVFLGDLDGDGIVGIVDFLALLANWGPCEPGCCLADLDLDGDVGILDLLLLLGNWG